jgi:hypothetical protein
MGIGSHDFSSVKFTVEEMKWVGEQNSHTWQRGKAHRGQSQFEETNRFEVFLLPSSTWLLVCYRRKTELAGFEQG